MQKTFYDLSGGVNQSATKTELGLNTKKLYWADSKNVEILQNSGIVRQNGNQLLFSLADEDKIIGIHSLKDGEDKNLIVGCASGKIYLYSAKNQLTTLIDKTISGASRMNFVDFLDGVICSSKNDELFYINNDPGYTIESCNLCDNNSVPVKSDAVAVYKGRVWVANGATLYYSALGRYNDFTTEKDAGYLNNFHTDTEDICALKIYKDYLAIYKKNSVYLLSGTSNEDFKVVPFADKGTASPKGVVTVNNKQYFINQGVFSMEQAGLLSQIQLGDEISLNIKPEFKNFDKARFSEIILLHYELKNQVWFFIPYINDEYFHTIWIYSYINHAWFKRVVPQNITSACLSGEYIISADDKGKVYQEDFGTSFNGKAIDFLWKSPFLASGDSNVRKTIEEFFFVLDETYDNNFQFSVYKNYDSEYKDDSEVVYSANSENLIWHGENLIADLNYSWSCEDLDSDEIDEEINSIWATSADSVYKAEISESNYSVQLCVEGSTMQHNAAIIGLEFKEIYIDG